MPKQTKLSALEPLTAKTKFINRIVLIALVIVAISILRILTWALDNQPVLTIKNSPFPSRIIREDPKIGAGVIVMTASYCKNKDIDGDLRLSFLSKSREVFLPTTKERGPNECKTTDFSVVIPKELPPDEYTVKFRIIYNKNPLKQNEIVEFESKPVKIGPK